MSVRFSFFLWPNLALIVLQLLFQTCGWHGCIDLAEEFGVASCETGRESSDNERLHEAITIVRYGFDHAGGTHECAEECVDGYVRGRERE